MARVKISSKMNDALPNRQHSSLFLDNPSELGAADGPEGVTHGNFIKAQPLTPRDINKLPPNLRVQAFLRSIKASVVSKVLDMSEFSTKFNVTRFIRVIIYHQLYWFTGPIVVIPLITLFDSFGLSKNMGFWFGT